MSLFDRLLWRKFKRAARDFYADMPAPNLVERLRPTTYTISGAELIAMDDARPVHSLFLHDGVWMWRPWPNKPLANTADFCRDDGVWYAEAEEELRKMSLEQQRAQLFRLWLLPSAMPDNADPERIWL